MVKERETCFQILVKSSGVLLSHPKVVKLLEAITNQKLYSITTVARSWVFKKGKGQNKNFLRVEFLVLEFEGEVNIDAFRKAIEEGTFDGVLDAEETAEVENVKEEQEQEEEFQFGGRYKRFQKGGQDRGRLYDSIREIAEPWATGTLSPTESSKSVPVGAPATGAPAIGAPAIGAPGVVVGAVGAPAAATGVTAAATGVQIQTPGQLQPGQLQPGQLQPGQLQPGQLTAQQLQSGQPQPGQLQSGELTPQQPQPGQPQQGQRQRRQPPPGEPQPGQPQPGQPQPGQLTAQQRQSRQRQAQQPQPGQPPPGQPQPDDSATRELTPEELTQYIKEIDKASINAPGELPEGFPIKIDNSYYIRIKTRDGKYKYYKGSQEGLQDLITKSIIPTHFPPKSG